MQEKILSEFPQNSKEKEDGHTVNSPRTNAEYRRILPIRLYRVGEALFPVQAVFLAWGFFVSFNKWLSLLNVLVSFFGLVFLVRHKSQAAGQNEWIIIKLALLGVCLMMQVLLSIIGAR